MSRPKHLDGKRNIPVEERSRLRMGDRLYELLARIRTKEGVDPNRYPPIESDIQYDITRTMTGAEITARETADLILPAIRTAESIAAPSGNKTIRMLLMVLLGLSIATATLAWQSYQYVAVLKNRHNMELSRHQHLGLALASDPSVTIIPNESEFIVKRDNREVLRVPHKMTPEELKELRR